MYIYLNTLLLTNISLEIFDSIKFSFSFHRATYNGLESLLLRIDRNLEDKQHSLSTDIMCLDMRSTLKTGDRTRLPNETDRNIVLTRMEKEIPLES